VQHRPGLLHPARFGDADEVAAFMTTSFGPAVALAQKLPAERRAELHADIGAWAGRAVVDGRWRLEYVVTVARRA
jgi:hypothetical protein